MDKIIHQIWIGPYEMPDREKQYVLNVKEMNPTFIHYFWTNDNLPELPINIQTAYDYFMSQRDFSFAVDILRIFFVWKFGGLYIDVDFKPLKTFDCFDENVFNAFVCYHVGNDFTIPNGVLGGNKNSPLIEFLYNKIDLTKNGWYGPSWLGAVVKEYLQLPYEIDHNIVKAKCLENNINYFKFFEFETYFKHNALYSWSPENKKNFEIGNINYLK